MAITYNAGQNIIYNPDGGDGSEMTYADILAAGGGWGGVFKNPHPSYYESTARILCNGGWLKQYNEVLAFVDNAGIPANQPVMQIYSNGGFVVGEKYTYGGKNFGVNGGAILWLSNLVKTVKIQVNGATSRMYDLKTVRVPNDGNRHFEIYITAAGTLDMYNCHLNGLQLSPTVGACTVKKVMLSGTWGLTKPLIISSTDSILEDITVSNQSFGCYIYGVGAKTRGLKLNAQVGIYNIIHGTSYHVDAEIYPWTAGRYIANYYSDSVGQFEQSWQPTFRLGSTSGPVIQDLDVKLVDGKGLTRYASPGYGGSDAKTDSNGQLDFLSAGIGPVADTADLVYRTLTGTSEMEDDSYKNHLVYAKKAGLIELPGAKLIMDRTRLNCPVYVLPKSAISYPAGITIGEQGAINVVKEPRVIKVVR